MKDDSRTRKAYYQFRVEVKLKSNSDEENHEMDMSATSPMVSRRSLLKQVIYGGSILSVGTYAGKAFAAVKNTYPGGNQIKSMRSMGGLPKKIRSICRVMVSYTLLLIFVV